MHSCPHPQCTQHAGHAGQARAQSSALTASEGEASEGHPLDALPEAIPRRCCVFESLWLRCSCAQVFSGDQGLGCRCLFAV